MGDWPGGEKGQQPTPQQAGFGAPQPGFGPQGQPLIAEASDPRSLAEVFSQFDEKRVEELDKDHPDVKRVIAAYRKDRVEWLAKQQEKGKRKEGNGEKKEKKTGLDLREAWPG